ncbi:hypothetical protein GCM10011504_56340 [Siccirubricoccus deserti]|nr:hypothetical protein GCM10011504_56340 [Siccirubricoccus deserti]
MSASHNPGADRACCGDTANPCNTVVARQDAGTEDELPARGCGISSGERDLAPELVPGLQQPGDEPERPG